MLKIIKENSANQNDKKFWVRFAKLGFSRDKSLYPESDEYNEILERITKIKFPEKRSIELPKYSLDEVKNETKSLRKKILAGVSLKISSFENELKMSENTKKVINKYKQNNVLYQMGTKTIDDFQQDIIKIYKDGTRTSSIYDIPIEPIEEDSMIGNCIKGPVIIVGDEDNNIERFLKMLPVLNEVIYLGNDYNKLSVGTYMHEMTHMLLDRHKGVVENYFNDEFLSIFMEKVAVDEVDDTPDKRFVKILEIYRMAHVKRNIEKLEQKQENKTDKYDLMKYISSSLLAGVLFDRYQNANSSERKRILSKIANVFNGQTKLNTFIEDEGISIEGEEAKKYIEKVNTYIGEISLNERPTNVEHLLTEDDKIEAFGNIGKEIISDVQNKKEEVK